MIRKDRQPLITFITFIMLVIFLVSCITGCSTTVPATARFPGPPEKAGGSAMTACPQLKELNSDPKLTEISKTINVNYSTYYECAVRVDTWIEWYHGQKEIFEKAAH